MSTWWPPTTARPGRHSSPTVVRVNQDNAVTDGFSEGTATDAANAAPASSSGRPQFMPSVAVDQATGTLVASYFDARDDAARRRYATYMTTSIDGGQRSRPIRSSTRPLMAFDQITQKNVTLGPIPDNQSSGNPNAEPSYSFGDHQGLAVFNGHVYAAWSGDQNGATITTAAPTQLTATRLDILVAPMRIAAGPRVVSSTMGVVTPLSVPVPPWARGAVQDQRSRPGHRCAPAERVPGAVRPRDRSEHADGQQHPGLATWHRGLRPPSS